MAGVYTGNYDGLFMDAISMAPFPVIGPLALELGAGDACAESGVEFCQLFEIAEGATLEASYGGGISMLAMLAGGVDCATGDFAASSTGCAADVIGVPSGCSVEMTGSFDPATRTITGSFSIPSDWGRSEGAFSVSLQP